MKEETKMDRNKHIKRNKKEKGASVFNTALKCATWKFQITQKQFTLLIEILNTVKENTEALLDSIRY
jgi:hypothetical protein